MLLAYAVREVTVQWSIPVPRANHGNLVLLRHFCLCANMSQIFNSQNGLNCTGDSRSSANEPPKYSSGVRMSCLHYDRPETSLKPFCLLLVLPIGESEWALLWEIKVNRSHRAPEYTTPWCHSAASSPGGIQDKLDWQNRKTMQKNTGKPMESQSFSPKTAQSLVSFHTN